MSFRFPISGPRAASGGAGSPAPRPPRAFTLIELMIVVGIMGTVMAMSAPVVYKVWRKAPMRQAVSSVVEVFSRARARAILQGTTVEVILYPRDNRLGGDGARRP